MKGPIKKITYKGESYEIDNWIECESCKTWRIVKDVYQGKRFICSKIGKKCSTK